MEKNIYYFIRLNKEEKEAFKRNNNKDPLYISVVDTLRNIETDCSAEEIIVSSISLVNFFETNNACLILGFDSLFQVLFEEVCNKEVAMLIMAISYLFYSNLYKGVTTKEKEVKSKLLEEMLKEEQEFAFVLIELTIKFNDYRKKAKLEIMKQSVMGCDVEKNYYS